MALADATGISRATVTTVTAELIAAGLIEETGGPGPAPGADAPGEGRGRPKVNLAICGDAHLVAGIKVAHGALSLALMDFAGRVLDEAPSDLPATVLDPCDLIAALGGALDRLMANHGGRGRLAGVGLGMPGVVDAEAGQVLWSPALTRRGVALGPEARAALGVPVFVDNDANLVALAEMNFGMARGARDFLVVTVERGVGLGIVLNNRLYRGARGSGGEFGHTKVQLDGALCRCGQRGCLEAYVADYALLREAAVLGEGGPTLTVDTLLAQAKAGRGMAASVVNRAGRIFAMGLANLVNIFDPEVIILAGGPLALDHLYAQEVIDAVADPVVEIGQPPPRVAVHHWGDLMWARGAGAYAIEGVEHAVLQNISDPAA
ncbi:MAG: ROK family transcriptional regulator [Pseudomonadota bacterium]